jgi:hypothetical protein
MHRLAGALLAVVAVAACAGDPGGILFRTTVEAPDGSYAQEVVLGDQTGLVTGIEPTAWDGQSAFDPPSVAIDEHDPSTLIFRWSNGACDRPAISFSRSGDRFDLRIDPREQFGSCTAILLFRSIRIHLTEPITPDNIDICCSGSAQPATGVDLAPRLRTTPGLT